MTRLADDMGDVVHEVSIKILDAFAEVFATFPDAQWLGARHFIQGDRGVSEWTFTGTRAADGARVEVHGCDVFTFRNGKIAMKNSYRKNRPPSLG